jgi:FAD/FMN-containing dehydrogenase
MLRASLLSLALGATTSLASPLDKSAAMEDCLNGSKVPLDKPGTEDWAMDAAPFNVRTPYKPLSIAVPTSVEEIQAAVKCGLAQGVKVNAKCGGHSYANFGFGGEDGHLMLELDRMNKVTLDKETGIATIQGGSRLGHVASELFKQGGKAFSHGTCPGYVNPVEF